MKTSSLKTVSPFRKKLLFAALIVGSLVLGSFQSKACTASFTTNAGLNGHYTFTSNSIGFGPGVSYSWNPGDGSGWHQTWFTNTYSVIYTVNTTYNVQLAANDSTCFDTITIPVTVSDITTPCTLSAGISVSYGSSGDVTFTSTSTGTNSNTLYYWSPGDSNQRYQEASVYTHKYLWDGYYTAWLTIQDTGTAYCIDSTEVRIMVTNADSSACRLHANFTYTLDSNGQVTFHSTSTGTSYYYVYNWNMGDTTGISSGMGDTSFVYTYAYNGTYNVTLLINADSSLCADSITIPVTITNACNLNVNFTVQHDSAGQVKFTSTTVGAQPGAQYGWSFGDNTSLNGLDTATHAYPFIGYYTVTLTVVNPGGCTMSSTQVIYIQNKDSLQADFVYASDSLMAGTYNFTSTSLGTNSNTYYKWTPGDGDPSDSGLGMTAYTHTYLSNGPYSATLTIWYTIKPKVKPHSSTAGRFDESSYTLVINVTGATAIPTINDKAEYTVYPNPSNGTFHIVVNGLAQEKNAEIRISNMMGQVIYKTNSAITGGNTLSDISLPNAANGIYLLQITTNGNTYTSRIAIQK